ncbi:hypothetical protein [Cylindrospermopsis raciborskii]|uniref:hypothetical protein n=1 Tax=Cylindrospermopsis raciborskii TaxID=77022 RepID=UPI001177D65A|nr:hypothetical protein [Cylindrospermopsis raciborskii]
MHRFPLSRYHVQRSIVNPPRKKFGAAVIGDKVNGDRSLVKVGKILVVLEIQLSQSIYVKVSNKEKLCL